MKTNKIQVVLLRIFLRCLGLYGEVQDLSQQIFELVQQILVLSPSQFVLVLQFLALSPVTAYPFLKIASVLLKIALLPLRIVFVPRGNLEFRDNVFSHP